MIAPHDVEGSLRLGVDPFFEVLNPSFINSYRIGVLRFAGHSACVTTDTAAVIDHKSIGRVFAGIHTHESTRAEHSRP